MKRMMIASAISLIFLTQLFAYAEEDYGMMGQKGMKGSKMTHPGMGMMKGMLSGQMVASGDGGVIVMMGNKLLKYDKDLVLKREMEIKVDMEEMQKMMMHRQEDCPMYKKSMQEGTN